MSQALMVELLIGKLSEGLVHLHFTGISMDWHGHCY